MKKTTRVLIVEDHIVVREGFVALVNAEDDLTVCGQTDNEADALALAEKLHPDVVVIDLMLRSGDGMELIKSLRQQYPKRALLVVSMQDEELYAERALRAGANGYVMKSAATTEFLDAIRAVGTGQIFISRKMNARLLHQYAHAKPGEVLETRPGNLTDRELTVFQLTGSGLATREIAERLGISFKTVETHKENIKVKLGIHNATALMQAAVEWVTKATHCS